MVSAVSRSSRTNYRRAEVTFAGEYCVDKITQNVIFGCRNIEKSIPTCEMTFARKLKTERIKLRLTQAQIAQLLSSGDDDGSPRKRTVEEWEAGRRAPMLISQEGVFARLREYEASEKLRDAPIRDEISTEASSTRMKPRHRFVALASGRNSNDAYGSKACGGSVICQNIKSAGGVRNIHTGEDVAGKIIAAG